MIDAAEIPVVTFTKTKTQEVRVSAIIHPGYQIVGIGCYKRRSDGSFAHRGGLSLPADKIREFIAALEQAESVLDAESAWPNR